MGFPARAERRAWGELVAKVAGPTVLLGALALVPSVLPPFRLFLATLVLVYVIVATGLNVVMGFSGQISVAHAAFMGVGAYTTAILMDRFAWPFPLALLAAILLTTVLGYVVGVPALRIAGHYLALATLAFQLIVETIIFNWDDVTNGPRGVPVPSATIGPIDLTGTGLYLILLAVTALAWVFVRNLVRSRVGRAWIAIRDREIAASVMGVKVARYKTLAFAISAAYAGLAGGLFAVTVGFLDPLAFNIWESVKQLTMVIFGGLGTLFGPAVGAALLATAPEFLRGFAEHALLVFYMLLLVTLLFLPGGLAAGFRRLAARLAPVRSDVRPATEAHADAAGRGPSWQRGERPEPSGVEAMPLLEVRGVSVHFGGLAALDRVDLTIQRGQIKGLIGPNGAGKTTLFNVVTRVYATTAGKVRFDGEDLLAHRAHDVAPLGMARTFQNVEMFRSMTVLQNVLVGLHHRGSAGLWRCGLWLPSARREETVAVDDARGVLRFLGLDRFSDDMADQLPLGLQRRVELARALASGPKLLLLDEPASGLATTEAQQLMQDVRAIRDAGVTILLIEHNMRFVMGLSDSVTTLDQGRVIFDGTPQDAQSDPDVIRAYLGEEAGQEEEPVRELST